MSSWPEGGVVWLAYVVFQDKEVCFRMLRLGWPSLCLDSAFGLQLFDFGFCVWIAIGLFDSVCVWRGVCSAFQRFRWAF